MSAAPFADRTVAEIAAALPGSTAVFRKHKLDFCCGGGARLEEAAAARGASLPALEAELGALVMPEGGAVPASTAALIALIQTGYHEVHRRELPELVRLARRVEAVHRDKAECPHGLADLLETMAAEMEDHMQKEEQILFPMMVRGGAPMIGHPIAIMRHEHDSHGTHLKALDALTHGATPPDGACNTWRALYAGIRKLEDDLMQHIHLENNVLFPRFGA
jgi:regulator of cell morphogenesis and NO signaling